MSESRLGLDEVEALGCGCLLANGRDQANAEAVAATVTVAERDGAASHGLFRIPGYVVALRSVNACFAPDFIGFTPKSRPS